MRNNLVTLAVLSCLLPLAASIPKIFDDPTQIARVLEKNEYESDARFQERIKKISQKEVVFLVNTEEDDDGTRSSFSDIDQHGLGSGSALTMGYDAESEEIGVNLGPFVDGRLSVTSLVHQKLLGRYTATNGFGARVVVNNWLQEVVEVNCFCDSSVVVDTAVEASLKVSPYQVRRVMRSIRVALIGILQPEPSSDCVKEFEPSLSVPNRVLRHTRSLDLKLLKIVIWRSDTNKILLEKNFK